MMTNFGNHIIALDYRGYGDSSGIPTVKGIVDDVLHLYKVIRKSCPDNPITIWGHSMGTGVASWTMHYLFQNFTTNGKIETLLFNFIALIFLLNIVDFKKPSGLVLEAPFYNTLQAFVSYPVTRVCSCL